MKIVNTTRNWLLSFLFETITLPSGKNKRRVKTAIFLWLSVLSLILGLIAIQEREYKHIGFSMIMTAFPILLLYPLVRAILGGVDSAFSAIGTVALTEYLKSILLDLIDKDRKRRK